MTDAAKPPIKPSSKPSSKPLVGDTLRPDTRSPEVSLGEVFATFLRIGLLSFGGPAGQIALMHRIIVDEKKWLSEERYLHALNYCMLLPGPEAQQLATYVGWLLKGGRGGLIAGLLFILPGFFVITGLSLAYVLFQSADWLETLFFGLKAAVLAIVLQAIVKLSARALKTRFAASLACSAFLGLFFLSLPFPLVVIAAAIAGYWTTPRDMGGMSAPRDDGPSEKVGLSQSVPTLLTGLILWLLPLVGVGLLFGWSSTFLTLAVFFSVLAVVSFGGAYAILAYVAQEAVTGYQWLTSIEMINGLAMAETTPGPLIIILTFVGFLAGFRADTGLDPIVAGLVGATLTTWVTFAPCFLWIFLGAPHVERLRSNPKLAGALSAITAAVVGVILNLAIWFALNVLFADHSTLSFGPASFTWPHLSSIDPLALGFAIVAIFLTFVVKLGVLPLLGLAAAASLALDVLGVL